MMNKSNTNHIGKVLFYNTERAYGFIIDSNNNKQIFVHKTGLIDPIKMNDEVTYEVTKTEKGLMAYNVRVVNKYIIIIDNKEYNDDNRTDRRTEN